MLNKINNIFIRRIAIVIMLFIFFTFLLPIIAVYDILMGQFRALKDTYVNIVEDYSASITRLVKYDLKALWTGDKK